MVQLSETMKDFANDRYRRGEADRHLAYSLLTGNVARGEDVPDYLDLVLLDDEPRITYITAKRGEGLSREEKFSARGKRVIARPGSVLQKVLGMKLDGHALDRIVSGAGAFLRPPDPNRYKLVSGEDIWPIFTRGELCKCHSYNPIASCATATDPHADRPGLKLYADVCEIGVAYCQTCKRPTARAIVWPCDDGKRYFDRVYGHSGEDAQLRRFLTDQGISSLGTYDPRVVKSLTPEQFAEYDRLSFPPIDTMNKRCDTCGVLSNAQCAKAERWVTWNYGRRGKHAEAARGEEAR